jgi:hypothetical protein
LVCIYRQKKRRNQDKGKYRNGSADIIGIEGMKRGEGDAAEPGISEERFLTGLRPVRSDI